MSEGPVSRLRILHVVPSYLPAVRYGGPIYSVHGLAKASAARGHDVHVFTTNADGDGASAVPAGTPVEIEGVKVTYFPRGLGYRLFRSPGLGRKLRREATSFDVLHLHSVFLWPTLAGARAARRARVPYVLSPRGMLVHDLIQRRSRIAKTAWIELFERANIARAAAVHFTSNVEKAEFGRMGLGARSVVVIPNGIDAPEPGTFKNSESPDRAPYVLSLGRINWKKGLDRLIRAFARVSSGRLVIAGNDEEDYTPRLEALARDMGVGGRVSFVGAVEGAAKWNLIRGAQLFVMPSVSENFGNSALEAMACGVPVIVTKGVGLADAISAHGAGLVCSGSPEDLAEGISALLGDSARRREMGAAGARAAREQYSWDAIAASFDDVYSRAAQGRRHDA
jgi:glycosyltransferase involved in cell wall biosynthesis